MPDKFPSPTLSDVQEALQYISPDLPRKEWGVVACAIKSEFGDGGLDLFDAWSQGGGSYKASQVKSTWRSVKAGGGTTIATLFHFAKEGGYQFKPISDDERAQREKQGKERAVLRAEERKKEEKRTRDNQRRKAKMAREKWEQAQPVDVGHGYLVRKQIHGVALKQMGDALLVPMLNPKDDKLWNLQSIYPEPRLINEYDEEPRDKDFMAGAIQSGLYCRIGAYVGRWIVCEGYATGESLYAATQAAIAVAFNAGNLSKVAQALRTRYPDAQIIIAGDDDRKNKIPDALFRQTEVSAPMKRIVDALHQTRPDIPIHVVDAKDKRLKLSRNTGVQEAIKAAALVGGIPVFPSFEGAV